MLSMSFYYATVPSLEPFCVDKIVRRKLCLVINGFSYPSPKPHMLDIENQIALPSITIVAHLLLILDLLAEVWPSVTRGFGVEVVVYS